METHYQKNREKILAYNRQYLKNWRAKNPDKEKEYRKTRAPKQKEYYEKWYKENGRSRADDYQEKIYEYQQEHPDRVKIQKAVKLAIKAGKIIRPDICPKCGRKARIQAHHFNYEHFMNFVWLCASCHKKEHLKDESL